MDDRREVRLRKYKFIVAYDAYGSESEAQDKARRIGEILGVRLHCSDSIEVAVFEVDGHCDV